MSTSLNMAAINLNLLVALDALLREQSVTQAARRVGVSQSAMSQSLGQLRDILEDPLMVRSGREMVLTPRAEAIRPGLQRVLGDLAQVLQADDDFDPLTLDRRFVIAGSDVIPYAFAPFLMPRLREQAPAVELVFETEEGAPAGLDDGSIDFYFGTAFDGSVSLPHVPIPQTTFNPLLRRGHPLAPEPGEPLSFEAWASIPQVLVGSAFPRTNHVDEFLAGMGLSRRILLRVQSALSVAAVLEHSDLCANLPRSLGDRMAQNYDIVVHELPHELPVVGYHLFWHPRWENDPAHRFMREMMMSAWDDDTRTWPEAR